MTTLVLRLTLAVVSIDLSFVLYVLYRRVARNRFYRSKDAAQEVLAAPVAQFVSGEVDVARARPTFQVFASAAERAALEELLLRGITPENHDRVSQLLIEMGYVQAWARTAFGRRCAGELLAAQRQNGGVPPARADSRLPLFPRWLLRMRVLAVRRAVAVSHLRRLSAKMATPLLMEAMRDPSHLPRRIAIAALGRQRDPQSIPLLLAELRKSVEETNDVSLRVVKAALTHFPASALAQFAPLLHDPNPRLRYFVIDIVREICAAHPEQGSRFAAQSSTLLEQLAADPSPDVRARTAEVIRHLPQANAVPALRKLMADDNEFVRLHAVRACADSFSTALTPELLACLSDRRWRVREAAVRALSAMGEPGIQQLLSQFLCTPDRYTSEQLSDHLQRSGVLQTVVARLSQPDSATAYEVCRKLVFIGHASMLGDYVLRGGPDLEARARLVELLASTPELVMPIVQTMAGNPAHPLHAKALELSKAGRGQAAGAN